MRPYKLGVFLSILACAPAYAQVSVLTANGDNGRTSSNLREMELSPATVSQDTFGKIGVFPVDGQVYAQILVASGITVPGKGVRNVAYVCTMHNSVYAFDANATAPNGLLWRVNLGTPVPSAQLYEGNSDVANE